MFLLILTIDTRVSVLSIESLLYGLILQLDLLVLRELESQSLSLYAHVQVNGDVEARSDPPVELFLDEAQTQNHEEGHYGSQDTGYVFRPAAALVLNDGGAGVETPEDLHVLVLLALLGVCEVVGGHLVQQQEVEDVGDADHYLQKGAD